jgi:triosephosphate isomerase
MIIVNFKNYKETFGDGALKLAEICQKVAKKTGVKIIPAVSPLDAVKIKEKLGMEVILQNTDPIFEGAGSGFVSPIKAKELGIDGTILNHSEHRVRPGTLKKMLKIWPKKFKVVVCIGSFGQTETWAKNIKPDFIAYEPKSLIGSSEKSVASEKSEVIKKIVKFYKNVPVLVGAGVHSIEDVKVSLKMGAKGILISSFIVKAKDPEKELIKLAEVF